MFGMEPYQVRCRTCFSIFSYLNGFCPVCGGTGFVSLQKPIPEADSTSKTDAQSTAHLLSKRL